MQKLLRDKSADQKALIAQKEMVQAHLDDITNKLRQQKEDYDKLLSGQMEAEEILKLETQKK